MVPSRQTFDLVPQGTDVIMYLVFTPFLIAFLFGIYFEIALIRSDEACHCRAGRHRWRAATFSGFRPVAEARRTPTARLAACGHLLRLSDALVRDHGGRIGLGRVAAAGRANPLRLALSVFEALLDALGFIFVISLIAALAWRLIRLRSTGPDQRRMQWQFVLLIVGLLYMGTTGFILEGLRLTLRPVPWADWSFIGNRLVALLHALGVEQQGETIYLALWWSHAVVAFTLIATLPYSAFLHSVAAPLNLMVHPGHPKLALTHPSIFGTIEASGNFDVKAGASTLADLNEAQRFALMACTNCGRCDSVCPAFASGTALSPRQLVQGLRGMQMAGDSRTDLLDFG